MNKKLLSFSLMGLLAISLVAAVPLYYALFSVNINVNQPMNVIYEGESVFGDDISIELDCIAGEVCLGEAIQLENTGDVDKSVFITDVLPSGVDVNYVGKMAFAEKNLETGAVSTSTQEIVYTITGEEFIVTGIPENYKLVYYPDIGTFTENVAGIIVLSEGTNSIGNLPISVDVGDSYCTNGFNPNAKVCNGAKLWLIPGTLDSASAKTFLTNWNTNAPSILFETDLITYTKTA